jgi:preprotein translocase YajC subunit
VPEFVLFTLVFLLVLAGYWSMVIFPKQRDFQKRQRTAETLKEGDAVVTYSGLIGKVSRIDSEQGIAYLEISDGVIAKFVIASLMHVYDPEEIASAARMGRSD